ncbi:hypothetical protein RD792_002184 [Penstemon davidsonii]|uniref:Pentatricopeptide repeat-containing protein-mitochondrial domain-containing protein n=1 Tax=Penstemon davidsonii TaxID=160366 RepID=A0ABR0DQC6_9LAMI|nr:hypothetical protein RD792_002184 [Penstemon davidsonii]
MESSSFSLKPQPLSLITRTPISAPLPPRRIGLFRSEFLGCGQNLRLPRRKCKKMRLKSHSHYNKFLFKASLDSQPILVVATAIAAASAITVVYYNYARKQFNIKEMTGRLTLALSEQIRSMTSWILTDSHNVDLRTETSLHENKDLMQETRKHNDADKDMVVETMFLESDTRGTLVIESPESQSKMVASSVHDNLAFGESGTTEASSKPSEVSRYDVPPLVTEASEARWDTHEQRISVAVELSVPVIPTNTSAAPSGGHINAERDELVGLKLELLRKSDRSISDLIFRESARKELYTINEASVEKLDSLEPLSSCATLQKNRSYSSLMDSSLMKGSNFIVPNIMFATGKLPLGIHSQGFFCQQKSSRNGKELGKEKNKFQPDRPKKLPPSLNAKGKHIHNKQNLSWQLRVYNQLVREGSKLSYLLFLSRLNDCIELLEDLEEKGLLDMDKVYHVRFFEGCKSQKAVKEAFRFTRLIRNPTLSAFQVLQHVQEAGLNADCKLYTTLVSTCAKSGKVDIMFKVFHEMVSAGVEPNVHTYGALIDGCAKAGQVAKAFGAYGILRSKGVKPDRVVFNALITACGQSGAVHRAFDVLAEMRAEMQPIDPDHITIGALMKACASAGQVDRAREVYNMIHEYDIRGTAELYTIAVNSCSHHGDWEFACNVYDDMIRKGVTPDEMFISALIDVAGHAGKVDAAFEILQEARAKGLHVGIISYSSLMGACCNARDWHKALELYEEIKGLNLKPTISLMNALITALCNADQLQMAIETLFEMKSIDLCPNTITYSLLVVASEKKDDLEAGLMLISQAKKDGVTPNLVMCRCLIAMCLRRFQKASNLGEPVLSFTSGQVQLNSRWTSLALMVYRETISAGVVPTMDELSLVLGCLQLPHDESLRNRLIEYLGVNNDNSKGANIYSRIDGFGEYDPRAFSLVEEAASLGVIPYVSFKESPIVVDVTNFQLHTAEVYFLTVLKGLKHRLAAGARVPNVNILLPIETAQIQTPEGEKTINISGRISQAVAALLRRLGISYQGNESYGKIRINGVIIRRWFQPKLDSPFGKKTSDLRSSLGRLGSGLSHQRRKIRTGHLSLD